MQTTDNILRNLAELNPVRDEPDHDEDANRGLVALLEAVRAEAAPAPPRARPIASHRLRRLPGWGATISIAAGLVLAVVIVGSSIGGQHALSGNPAAHGGHAH